MRTKQARECVADGETMESIVVLKNYESTKKLSFHSFVLNRFILNLELKNCGFLKKFASKLISSFSSIYLDNVSCFSDTFTEKIDNQIAC